MKVLDGDVVKFNTPGGTKELEILRIKYYMVIPEKKGAQLQINSLAGIASIREHTVNKHNF
jgi:hypothetical protein